MRPVVRLRLLCVVAFVALAAGAALVLPKGIVPVISGTFFVVLLCALAPIVGVFALHRLGRLLYPLSLFFQLGLISTDTAVVWTPAARAFALLAFVVSLLILVLIFTSPIKQLFIPPDPDAPVH